MAIGTLEKTIHILELLSEDPKGMTVTEISRKLGFPKSTTHRILSTFSTHDYIAQDSETKKYFLGLRLLQISSSILANLDIRKISERYLEELYEKSREVVHMYIYREGMMTCINKVGNPGGLTLSSFVGWTTEPHPSAAGKILLSGMSAETIRKIYRGRTLKKFGKRTITDIETLTQELEKIRKQGYAIDDEEYYEGVRCVAAPVLAGRKIVASISSTGPVFRMTMERINEELIHMVKETAESISRNLKEAAFLW
jgi:DNA-binding IclR family transcriptional regulator